MPADRRRTFVAGQNLEFWPPWERLGLGAALAEVRVLLDTVIVVTAALLYSRDHFPRTLAPCVRAAFRALFSVCGDTIPGQWERGSNRFQSTTHIKGSDHHKTDSAQVDRQVVS
jgi:hypothetical protein